MSPDQIGITSHAADACGLFHEPSPNGEHAPPPVTRLPGVPAMPLNFTPPSADEHLGVDITRGVETLS